MSDKNTQSRFKLTIPAVHSRIVSDLESLLIRKDCPKYRYLHDVFLTKYVGPDTDSAQLRKERAVSKWLATEQRNAKTNVRLYSLDPDFGFATGDEIIVKAAAVIRALIGVEPRLRSLRGAFSGGASTSTTRQPGSVAVKFTGQAHVTKQAWPYILPLLLEEACPWLLSEEGVRNPTFVNGNVMFTVPKSTMIDRVACKEPDLNMYAQKAVGDFIRQRLLKVGIDLNDQSRNQSLAREGSRTGTLATLDLSSASDSISTSLVARLLPPGWFDLLDNLRCQETNIDGTPHVNEMFSSMGNGFTFELETLIFYSIVRAICFFTRTRGAISVYGDDIICHTRVAPIVKQVFHFIGFSVNPDKSFWSGPFRESCGGHYYRGADITPFYIKEPIDNIERLIHFLNRLRRWSSLEFGDLCDPETYKIWQKYADYVVPELWGGTDLSSPNCLVTCRSPGN